MKVNYDKYNKFLISAIERDYERSLKHYKRLRKFFSQYERSI